MYTQVNITRLYGYGRCIVAFLYDLTEICNDIVCKIGTFLVKYFILHTIITLNHLVAKKP